VIPYSLEHTVLSFRKPGDVVNLETDIIARYVERLVGSG
jgi:riboflavin synthase